MVLLPARMARRSHEPVSQALMHLRASDFAMQDVTGLGFTFARAGDGGLTRDARGMGRMAAHSMPRWHCFDLDSDGVFETPTLLLEQARTNKLLRSQEFNNASWTKTRCSITTNALLAPDGTVTADKLVEDSSASQTHFLSQAITLSGVGVRFSVSCFVRAGERDDVILRGTDGTNLFAGHFDLVTGVASGSALGTGTNVECRMEKWIAVDGVTWWRCITSGTAGAVTTAVQAFVMLAVGASNTYTGDGASGLYVWGAQAEETTNGASTYLATTSATVTRPTESLLVNWPRLPESLTLYYRGVEFGAALESAASNFIINIGDGATRHVIAYGTGGSVAANHDSGPTVVGSTSTLSGVAHGDTLEVLGTISATGVVQVAWRKNGGAITTGAASGALAFAAAYGGSPVKLAVGSQVGAALFALLALRDFKVAAGVKTMDQMRALF